MISKKWFLIIIFSFYANALSGLIQKELICEPSLLFPEIFFIESNECFSYDTANSLYHNIDTLKIYLDKFSNSTNQISYRYSYYLRKKEHLPALMTLMIMINNNAVPVSIDDPFKEFNNIIVAGIKESKEVNVEKQFVNSNGSIPVSVKQLSVNFFSALSYIASYISDISSSRNTDGEIIVRSFNYTISNIQTGIDWNDDDYLNKIFNSYVTMKNMGLIESFTQFFYFYLRGDETSPSFDKYVKLRELGMIKDMRFSKSFENNNLEERNILAAFFLDNINELPEIRFTSNKADIENKGDIDLCQYLKERGDWLEKIADSDSSDGIFNESVKIVEQCPGSFSFPFLISSKTITVHEKAKWSVDLAIALSYIAKENISDQDSDTIIRGAVKSSLSKNFSEKNKSLAEDVLSYVFEMKKAEKVVKSFFVKQLPAESKIAGVDPVTEAAEILSKILF